MDSILNILTDEEKAFIKEYNLSTSDFYDARGETISVYHDKAKALGCHFVISQCQYGHRLKDRSGHCIICNTANISFQKRETKGGVVYVAVSGKYCKIGITEEKKKSKQESLNDREYRLNSEGGYASRDGWQIIKSWSIEKNVGKVEREAHRLLSQYHAEKSYIYSGSRRIAQEIFECSIAEAINAVKQAIQMNQ